MTLEELKHVIEEKIEEAKKCSSDGIYKDNDFYSGMLHAYTDVVGYIQYWETFNNKTVSKERDE